MIRKARYLLLAAASALSAGTAPARTPRAVVTTFLALLESNIAKWAKVVEAFGARLD